MDTIKIVYYNTYFGENILRLFTTTLLLVRINISFRSSLAGLDSRKINNTVKIDKQMPSTLFSVLFKYYTIPFVTTFP